MEAGGDSKQYSGSQTSSPNLPLTVLPWATGQILKMYDLNGKGGIVNTQY